MLSNRALRVDIGGPAQRVQLLPKPTVGYRRVQMNGSTVLEGARKRITRVSREQGQRAHMRAPGYGINRRSSA